MSTTFQSLLSQASSMIQDYSAVVAEVDASVKIDPQTILNQIKALGASTEEHLRQLSYEDLATCFPDVLGKKPIILIRDIARLFRGWNTESRPPEGGVLSVKKAAQMSIRELLAAYTPQEVDSAVSKRLASLSRGEPFLVYSQDGELERQVSEVLLQEILNGFTGRTTFQLSSGDVFPTRRVGFCPPKLTDENPIYVGRSLRGQDCDQLNKSWDGVPLAIRQLVRLIVQSSQSHLTLRDAHELMDVAVGASAWERLSTRYRDAAVAFHEQRATNSLPTLRILLKVPTSRAKNPLASGKKLN